MAFPKKEKTEAAAPVEAAPAAIDYEKLAGAMSGVISEIVDKKFEILMSRGKEVDTRDMKVEQVADIKLSEDGVLNTDTSLIVPDAKLTKNYLAALAFMEEPMEIVVAETEDQNAENPVTVGCNGAFRQFYRGIPTVTQRKFVDCLIVKTGRVTTPETINNAGERTNVIRQNSAHKYPFSVIRDDNPKGREWLRARLAAAI